MRDDPQNVRRDGRIPDALWAHIHPLRPPRKSHPLGCQRLLELIGAIAFLHQYQRPQGETHGITFTEAVPDNYELAAQLMQRCLGYAFEDLSPKAQELYAYVQQIMREHHQTTVTRGDICRWTSWPLAQVRKLLPQLTELGYLRALKGNKGQEYVYQLAESPRMGCSWPLGEVAPDEHAANGLPVDAEGTGDNGEPSNGSAGVVEASGVHA